MIFKVMENKDKNKYRIPYKKLAPELTKIKLFIYYLKGIFFS